MREAKVSERGGASAETKNKTKKYRKKSFNRFHSRKHIVVDKYKQKWMNE